MHSLKIVLGQIQGKLTLLNENVALILELVDFNLLSADDPKFTDSIGQIIINAGE
jgi:hypothetical protein